MMREINVSKIKEAVADLCLKANFELRKDVLRTLKLALKREKSKRARNILKAIIENAAVARKKRIAICQDTGFVSVFLEIGSSVLLSGDLYEAVNKGVEEAYKKGYLRKSVVGEPFTRRNTNTNTPCIVHTDVVEGDGIKISVSPKGFGSENKSAIRMFLPNDSWEDIKEFILKVVRDSNPADACPPLILGIGIGGTFDYAAHMAKRALLRPIDKRNHLRRIGTLERDILKSINSLNIGPMGLGGRTTALGVNIEEFPTHIAGLPVAVIVSCHATRSAEKML